MPTAGAFPVLTEVVDMTTASESGDPVPACRKTATGGVWFEFTPHASGRYIFSTCRNAAPGTTVADTVLAVYDTEGECPPRRSLGCNDNDAECEGASSQSTLRVDLDAFRRVFVLVYGGEGGHAGAVQVSIDRERDEILPSGDFETGTLGEDWIPQGDAELLPAQPPPPCLTADSPDWGCYLACLSTDDVFGGQALGGVRSDLTTRGLTLPFRPDKLEVTFVVDYQTEEALFSIDTNDAFEARLITPAGTFPILQIDTFGRTVPDKHLSVAGYTGFFPSPESCTLDGALRTRRLSVRWTKPLDASLKSLIGTGPVSVQFSVLGQGDGQGRTIACVDDVVVKPKRQN
jgi:hypothetical protein